MGRIRYQQCLDARLSDPEAGGGGVFLREAEHWNEKVARLSMHATLDGRKLG
ncbi:MAG: hypothetical protein M0021_11120 [Clostridia bacterium]|nr:hypothetical protein [Clostridia bacterium]